MTVIGEYLKVNALSSSIATETYQFKSNLWYIKACFKNILSLIYCEVVDVLAYRFNCFPCLDIQLHSTTLIVFL